MKIRMPKGRARQIVIEELARHARSLLEADGAPDVEDAEDQKGKKKKIEPASKGQPDNRAGKPVGQKDASPPKSPDEPAEVPGDAEEKPSTDDPADDDLDKQAAGEEEDDDEVGAEDTEKVSDELVGKTIQSISANPKSKMMPGAMEIVFQFDQIPEPLKILVQKSGKVVYYFKGLHNEI